MTSRESYVEQINLLENTLKMYNKTRNEMITNGAEIDSLEKIDAEINRISADLTFYKKLLNKLDDRMSNETCNYKGYIEFHSNPNCKSKDFENDNGYVFYKKKDEDRPMNSNDYDREVKIKTLIDNHILIDSELSPIMSNRFLVKFPKDIDLETKDILSINGGVYGDYNINSLNIIFREFERENFCLPYLLIKLIKDRVKFNIVVETLKPNLDVLYVTEYVDVRFTQFTDSDKDYSSDDINKYIVKAVFDDVKYYVPLKNETSCKEG